MKTKILAMGIMLILAFSGRILAHDEGHGPKLSDVGKYGGLVAPVVDFKDAKKGAKAPLLYKAELVRSSDETIRVYLYDASMKPLDLSRLEKSGEGVLGAEVKGKHQTQKFDLMREGNAFTGKSPKPPSRPFDLDFHFKEPNRTLLTAFDNLD